MATALIVLAAGKGTRMMSDLPKVLHPIAGAPLLAHALRAGASIEPAKTVVVAGHGAELVEKAAKDWAENAEVVVQSEQLGTAHAVAQAKLALHGFDGDVIVLYGDTPFISPQTLEEMIAKRQAADVVVLGFEASDPARYGRLVMQGDALQRIVEFKDASDDERKIAFCNSGVIAADAKTLFSLIDQVDNDNASGEFYLTDIVDIARKQGLSATAVRCDEAETLGINSRSELVAAEAAYQQAARLRAIDDGAILQAPDTVFFAFDTAIGRDATVEPNVVFGLGTTIESGATIRAFSHLEGCHVARGAVVGPYARLRRGAELQENTKVGNFVEVKNAILAEGAKANHLSYIGDAEVGARSNIGAGTITCNYDGVFKHQTKIGEDVFIGSNTMLVAPVTIGSEAMTASGSVISSDVPKGDLAVARARQENKPGFARRMFEMLKKKKKSQAKGA